jgi:antitoxin HicB
MEIYRDEEGACWAAEFPELPGLVAAHETWGGLLESIDDAKRAWFESMVADGAPIPEPRADPAFSGKLQLRLPKSLHAQAARTADLEGVSLNTIIVAALAKELGQRLAP